jgi:thiosulfate reductase cytochrome b subunit
MDHPETGQPKGGDLVRRHGLSTRVWHGINALTIFIMLMSGAMILNAHPRLYWGEYGANPDAAWLTFGSMDEVPFPPWLTIPSFYSLADARLWHLAFAWVLMAGAALYLVWSLLNGHLRRDLWPAHAQWRPSHIWHDIKQHARLRFPTGLAALDYNVLQKFAYLGVLLVLLPLVILTGLCMSPGFDAATHITSLLGGRASARSIHFLCACGFALFIAVHLVMVVLAGPINELRSMITGHYRLPVAKGERP